MGFKNGVNAMLWEITPEAKRTKARITISRKDPKGGGFISDFSGYVTFIGKAHEVVKNLQPKTRVHLISCDVTTSGSKETKFYTNFIVWECELSTPRAEGEPAAAKSSTVVKADADGCVEVDDDGLPF